MNTKSINHRPATVAAAVATGFVGALLAVTLDSAHAIPERLDHPTLVDRTVLTNSHYLERACFIKQLTWNEGLDGPVPRCRTYVP